MKSMSQLFHVASSKRVVKGIVTPMRSVPKNIKAPEYSQTGRPYQYPKNIRIYNEDEIPKLRAAARLARKILDFSLSLAKEGLTTEDIDILAHEEIIKHGAYPSPINYCNFPKAICTSVNEVVCHGIPDSRPLVNGDILSIDVSVYLNGFHGDNCGTVVVGGTTDERGHKLISTTYEALDAAIAKLGPGV